MIEDEGYSPIGRFSMEAGLFKKQGWNAELILNSGGSTRVQAL